MSESVPPQNFDPAVIDRYAGTLLTALQLCIVVALLGLLSLGLWLYFHPSFY